VTPPAVTDIAAVLDSAWFAAHSGRTCYARAVHDWVLVVKHISQGRDQPPVLLRTWTQFERIPDWDA